jgi:hypothetical protein
MPSLHVYFELTSVSNTLEIISIMFNCKIENACIQLKPDIILQRMDRRPLSQLDINSGGRILIKCTDNREFSVDVFDREYESTLPHPYFVAY